MKKIILGLLLMPVAAEAQHSIKIGVGGVYNSKPKVVTPYDKGGINTCASVSYSYAFKQRWEFGLSVMVAKLSASQKIIYTQSGIEGDKHTLKTNLGNPVYVIGVLANRRIEVSKIGCLYFGGYAGYLSLSENDKIKHKQISTGEAIVEYTQGKGSGFSLGAQIGYDVRLSKVFALGIELAPRYANIKSDVQTVPTSTISYSLFYMPVQLGITYKF